MTLTCRQCGTEFEKPNRRGPVPRYCSGRCRARHHRDHPTVPRPPQTWVKCPTCGLAFAYVRRMSMSRGWMWVWERECKHRSDPVIQED